MFLTKRELLDLPANNKLLGKYLHFNMTLRGLNWKIHRVGNYIYGVVRIGCASGNMARSYSKKGLAEIVKFCAKYAEEDNG